MSFEQMTDMQRISAAHFDIMRHPEFALLSGIVTMGKVEFVPGMATAGTNGRDVFYGPEFMRKQNRKQVRWVVLHENFHKGLRHCVLYTEAEKKSPMLSNIAMDYVVNALIEQADPAHDFIEHPTGVKPLLDTKYYDWSFPKVFMDLYKESERSGGGPGGGGIGEPVSGSFDEHKRDELDAAVEEQTGKEITDALYQGQILSKTLKKRSATGSGGSLNVSDILDRRTNWKEQLRDFVTNIMRGNDVAKWNKINQRIFAATGRQVILPTLYNESVGEIVVAADTSGSMGSLYPLLFGEVSRVAEDTTPEKLTIIWWDTKVANVQEFNPSNYRNIKSAMKPAGGGGTTPQCVVDYMIKKKMKPQCVIWLTDGYIGDEPTGLSVEQLWGVVDNTNFNARSGKTLHIDSMAG